MGDLGCRQYSFDVNMPTCYALPWFLTLRKLVDVCGARAPGEPIGSRDDNAPDPNLTMQPGPVSAVSGTCRLTPRTVTLTCPTPRTPRRASRRDCNIISECRHATPSVTLGSVSSRETRAPEARCQQSLHEFIKTKYQ